MGRVGARLRLLERTLNAGTREKTPTSFAEFAIAEARFGEMFGRFKSGERVPDWPDTYEEWLEREAKVIVEFAEFLNYPNGPLRLVGSVHPMPHETLDPESLKRFFGRARSLVKKRQLAGSRA